MEKRTGSNNRTSILVAKQLPEFIREEHGMFVQFLEYYYKFLEQDGKTLYAAKNFSNYLDVDSIYEDVLEKGEEHEEGALYHNILDQLYNTYINKLPQSIIADKAMILKHAKDFYRSKGSPKSVEFLLRALYGVEASIYLPKTDILETSQGIWHIEKSLKVADIQISDVYANGSPVGFTANNDLLPLFVNYKIFGANSNAYAVVESTNRFYEGGKLVSELLLSGQVRDFINGEQIQSLITYEGVPKLLRANLFSGIVSSVKITTGGAGYEVGYLVPVVPADKGAQIVISKVTSGALNYISVVAEGAGFQTNDPVLITGGSGSGATAIVEAVDNSGTVHPSSYSIVASTIALEADTPIGNASFSNLNSSNANTTIANSVDFWTYANTGPAILCLITNPGSKYKGTPSLRISSNTAVRSLGILGRMEIYNGGLGYLVGDPIVFENPFGSFGTGAEGVVSSVNASGSITHVQFVEVPGNPIGGTGYNQDILPKANVISMAGHSANIAVTSILGAGETLLPIGETAGVIKELTILSGGSGYYEPPYLDFAAIPVGFGAQAAAQIVSGVYSYPGKFIGDDGFISSYNFIQDRDYYQKYSYVVRSPVSYDLYKKYVNDLTHPIGTKIFAEYTKQSTISLTGFDVGSVRATQAGPTIQELFYESKYDINGYRSVPFTVNKLSANYAPYAITSEYLINTTPMVTAYFANSDLITVATNGNDYRPGQNVYLQFSNPPANVVNGMYTVTQANDYFFTVSTVNGNIIWHEAFSSVLVYNPEVFIAANQHGLAVNDVVYIEFFAPNSNTMLSQGHIANFPLANGEVYRNNYKVRSVGLDYFTIEHANIHLISSNVSTGLLNTYIKLVSVTANNHGLSVGDVTYVDFYKGDKSNANSGYYVVKDVKDANTVNITVPRFIFANSNNRANVHTKTVNLRINSHSLTSSDYIYTVFQDVYDHVIYEDGLDLDVNLYGTHNVTVVNANVISIVTKYPIGNTNNLVANVYRSGIVYSNATIHRANHGLSVGNTVIAYFDAVANIQNNLYTVTDVKDSNTYNISNVHVIINENVLMSDNVSVGLYK